MGFAQILANVILLSCSISQSSLPNTTDQTPSSAPISPTLYFTTPAPEQGCTAQHAFVYVHSETLTSERVNYPPYAYPYVIRNKPLIWFANGTDNHNNPCNISTWTAPRSDYNHKIIIFEYNQYSDALCSTQQWTLNIQNHSIHAQAVLIANDKDLNHVYSLPGDTPLKSPTIPTRMISQSAAIKIKNMMKNTTEPILASIGCFNDTTPCIICVLDDNILGIYWYLDGEYQRQDDILVNDHPVWLKDGYSLHHVEYTAITSDYYIWLSINHSATSDAWTWVIGTQYSDDTTIVAACRNNVDDPTLCGRHWYINETLEVNLSSSDGICDLSDNYICVDSLTTYASDFRGRYRQIHQGTPLWVSQTSSVQSYVVIEEHVSNLFADPVYAFVFYRLDGLVHIARMGTLYIPGWYYAVCPIKRVSEGPLTREETLSPHLCNDIWAVFVTCVCTSSYRCQCYYGDDPTFDVDECPHPNGTNVTSNQPIIYPQILCFNDASNAYSHHQGWYGVWVLDNATSFDDRYVYYNQRFESDGLADSYYMIYYNEEDAWVINQAVPSTGYLTSTYEGICDEDVNTPDLCTACWVFAGEQHTYTNERLCNVTLNEIASLDESKCMEQPMNTIAHDTIDITLCFDDGNTPIYSNKYTGIYRVASAAYHGRSYWYSHGYYIFYDQRYRYWVLDDVEPVLGASENNWDMYCLQWDQFEPFNCSTWYIGCRGCTPSIVTMDSYCTLEPTSVPTVSPSNEPTRVPTPQPTSMPRASPTRQPTSVPTVSPSNRPTNIPTIQPTTMPTLSPSVIPSYSPTKSPIYSTYAWKPTSFPTWVPTAEPTSNPTTFPTWIPTFVPTYIPTFAPTLVPVTKRPTSVVSITRNPTIRTTLLPTSDPTTVPTDAGQATEVLIPMTTIQATVTLLLHGMDSEGEVRVRWPWTRINRWFVVIVLLLLGVCCLVSLLWCYKKKKAKERATKGSRIIDVTNAVQMIAADGTYTVTKGERTLIAGHSSSDSDIDAESESSDDDCYEGVDTSDKMLPHDNDDNGEVGDGAPSVTPERLSLIIDSSK